MIVYHCCDWLACAVLQLIRPKTMQGQFVTGRMLAGLAQAYIAAINAHAVPSIGNAWDGVTRVECKEALEAAFHAYVEARERSAPDVSFPLDEAVLTLAHEQSRFSAMFEYEGKAVGPMAGRWHTLLVYFIRVALVLSEAVNCVTRELLRGEVLVCFYAGDDTSYRSLRLCTQQRVMNGMCCCDLCPRGMAHTSDSQE